MKGKIQVFRDGLAKFLKVVLNRYTLFIIVSLLSLYAMNIVAIFAISAFITWVFVRIFLVVKRTQCKKDCLIGFSIFCAAFIGFSGVVIYKIPALSYNFGTPKPIETADEISYCLDKGIKAVSFVPKYTKATDYVLEKSISFMGGRGAEIGKDIKFNYSLVKLKDTYIILRHSENKKNLTGKTVTAYLSEFQSIDQQVHDCYQDRKVFKATFEFDSNVWDSSMLWWRICTVSQFVVALMSLGMCIYTAIKYYRNRSRLT